MSAFVQLRRKQYNFATTFSRGLVLISRHTLERKTNCTLGIKALHAAPHTSPLANSTSNLPLKNRAMCVHGCSGLLLPLGSFGYVCYIYISSFPAQQLRLRGLMYIGGRGEPGRDE